MRYSWTLLASIVSCCLLSHFVRKRIIERSRTIRLTPIFMFGKLYQQEQAHAQEHKLTEYQIDFNVIRDCTVENTVNNTEIHSN